MWMASEKRPLHPKYCRHLDPWDLLYTRCSASWKTDLKLLCKVKPNLAGPRGGSTWKNHSPGKQREIKLKVHMQHPSQEHCHNLQNWCITEHPHLIATEQAAWFGEELRVLRISSEEIHNTFDIQSKAVPVIDQGVTLTGFRCSKVRQPGLFIAFNPPWVEKIGLWSCHFIWPTLTCLKHPLFSTDHKEKAIAHTELSFWCLRYDRWI